MVLRKLGLEDNTDVKLDQWCNFLEGLQNPKQNITIGLVGKYVELQDAINLFQKQLFTVELKTIAK